MVASSLVSHSYPSVAVSHRLGLVLPASAESPLNSLRRRSWALPERPEIPCGQDRADPEVGALRWYMSMWSYLVLTAIPRR